MEMLDCMYYAFCIEQESVGEAPSRLAYYIIL